MAILDDSSLKIDPYYKTTNGYTHMYLASDDVLMDDDKTTLQTKMNSVDRKLTDAFFIENVSVQITCNAGKTYKTTTTLDKSNMIHNDSIYQPFIAFVRGTGSNNIYNYYVDVRAYADGTGYNVYTEWKNPSTTNVSANATVSVVWGNINLATRDYVEN